MRVFVTGATGLIGQAVTAELIRHGHGVNALVRSESSATAAQALGADPLAGAMTEQLAALFDNDPIRQGRATRGRRRS